MAVYTDPLDFVSLFGIDGLGFLVGERDNTTNVNARKNAVNQSYVELAGLIRGVWSRRSFDYTSSSTPALTDGTRAYNTPTTSGAVFDRANRLYYRESGTVVDVPIVGDAEWLEKSATRSTDTGHPQYARIVRTSSAFQLELNRPMSANFISNIGTLTLEYTIAVAHLTSDTDTTILPRNLVHLIIPVAGLFYAKAQGDFNLAKALEPEAERARAAVLRHDLTRTGRARQIRPTTSYTGQGGRRIVRDYGGTN